MNQEQKLLTLLRVATENSWKPQHKLQEYIIEGYQSFSIFEYVVGNHQAYEDYKEFSLNDLVSNFEEGEVSFIDALLEATSNDQVFNFVDDAGGITDVQTLILYNWVVRPTTKRLEWLFETFSHLLK